MTRDPWATVTGATSPPPWQGPTTVHRMPDDEAPKREPVEKRETTPATARVAKPKRERKEDAAGIRTCSKCRKTYPATPEYFYRSKRELGGLRRECKTCFGEHPSSMAPRRTEPSAAKLQELQQLARRCVATILSAIPPWTLLEPGSPKEAFARKVPACVWWQFPRGEWPFPVSAHKDPQ